MSRKIGILGGTFNPIHNGHLAAANEVRHRLKLDRVLFIPSNIPPHKQNKFVPSSLQRMEMVKLATAGNEFLVPSDIEIRRGGTSYTVDTIQELLDANPDTEISFIMGIDTFLEIQTWHLWERLLGLCQMVVLSRPGYRFSDLVKIDFMQDAAQELAALDQESDRDALIGSGGFRIVAMKIPLQDISSTDIRMRFREGLSVKYLLPEVVETYIIKNNLYV